MGSRDELSFQYVAKEISRWVHKAEIFPDHDHHHGNEFYKPKRYVAANIAVPRTVPGQELEKKIQLATSANEEATAHFLRTCAVVERYKAGHFEHDENSSLSILDLCCPLDHGFEYEERDLFGTTICYNAENAIVYNVLEVGGHASKGDYVVREIRILRRRINTEELRRVFKLQNRDSTLRVVL